MKKWMGLILLFLIPHFCFGAVWKMNPEKSSITFTATQNNAPVKGNFKKFSGEINFDPNKLTESHVIINIEINSVSTSYPTLTETLLSPDWFNVKKFPIATFKSTAFTKVSDKEFVAQGNLTIRDKTIPTTINFTLQNYSEDSAVFVGHFTLKRLSFDVGQGDWAKTDQVKANVEVNFIIAATK